MDVVCSICGKQYGYKEGEGISHGICIECLPEYLADNGFTQREISQTMEREHDRARDKN